MNFLLFLVTAPPLAILAGWLGFKYLRWYWRDQRLERYGHKMQDAA